MKELVNWWKNKKGGAVNHKNKSLPFKIAAKSNNL
jgi:hypothetical protein